MPRKEKCSNCGKESMENIVVNAWCFRTKKIEEVRIGRCSNCGHLRSLNSWFAGL